MIKQSSIIRVIFHKSSPQYRGSIPPQLLAIINIVENRVYCTEDELIEIMKEEIKTKGNHRTMYHQYQKRLIEDGYAQITRMNKKAWRRLRIEREQEAKNSGR